MEKLILGFDYTIWGNRQWVEILGRFPDPVRAEEILRHMSDWQRRWLQRASLHITGEDVDLLRGLGVGEALEQGARDWQSFLLVHADQDVAFTRDDAVDHVTPLHCIAQQLVFHSAYHRGQLRGLAEAQGLDEFPDTDWFYFCNDPAR